MFDVQLADAAIEEQLEVQTAFREHGARLQQIYDKRQRTDMDIARREQEMKQLQGAALVPSPLILCDYPCTQRVSVSEGYLTYLVQHMLLYVLQ